MSSFCTLGGFEKVSVTSVVPETNSLPLLSVPQVMQVSLEETSFFVSSTTTVPECPGCERLHLHPVSWTHSFDVTALVTKRSSDEHPTTNDKGRFQTGIQLNCTPYELCQSLGLIKTALSRPYAKMADIKYL